MADVSVNVVRGYGPSQIMAPASALSRVVSAESMRISQTASATVGSGVALIFENGWENETGLGCSTNLILDGPGGLSSTSWGDFGSEGGFACDATPPYAEIVTAEKHDGNRSLRLNFIPSGMINGPDFRMSQNFPVAYNNLYMRWWVKYSANWVWHSSDHKIVLVGAQGQVANSYFNVRGDFDSGPGRPTIFSMPVDTFFQDESPGSPTLTPGVWHLLELHIVSGANGQIEAKVDGTLLTLVSPHGFNPNNVNMGPPNDTFRIDTTYNTYSYPSGLGLTMQTWFDSFAISTQGWIGA